MKGKTFQRYSTVECTYTVDTSIIQKQVRLEDAGSKWRYPRVKKFFCDSYENIFFSRCERVIDRDEVDSLQCSIRHGNLARKRIVRPTTTTTCQRKSEKTFIINQQSYRRVAMCSWLLAMSIRINYFWQTLGQYCDRLLVTEADILWLGIISLSSSMTAHVHAPYQHLVMVTKWDRETLMS